MGAGPAGACLAWSLRGLGLRIVLLDRDAGGEGAQDRAPFRGEALMPSGLEALESMGLGAILEAIPHRPLQSWQMHVEGQTLFRAQEPWGAPQPCTLVPQAELLEALLTRCRQQPGLTVSLGRGVSDLLWSDHHHVQGVRLDDGRHLRARLVVGADGRASLCRRLAGLDLDPGPGPGLIVHWYRLPEPWPTTNAGGSERTFLSVIAGGELFSLFGAARGDSCHLALVREPQDSPPATGERLARQLAALAPPALAPWLRRQGQGQALEHPVSLQVPVGQAQRWHRPGLLLLGDAAHPMSPVRAQGLNMALRDALVAGRLLARMLPRAESIANGDPGLANALATIEARRRPEITAMQRLQAQETRRGLLLRRQPLLRALLATAAPWVGPLLGHHWMTSQRPLRLGLADLSDDDATPG